jgi:hypothetical protein
MAYLSAYAITCEGMLNVLYPVQGIQRATYCILHHIWPDSGIHLVLGVGFPTARLVSLKADLTSMAAMRAILGLLLSIKEPTDLYLLDQGHLCKVQLYSQAGKLHAEFFLEWLSVCRHNAFFAE